MISIRHVTSLDLRPLRMARDVLSRHDYREKRIPCPSAAILRFWPTKLGEGTTRLRERPLSLPPRGPWQRPTSRGMASPAPATWRRSFAMTRAPPAKKKKTIKKYIFKTRSKAAGASSSTCCGARSCVRVCARDTFTTLQRDPMATLLKDDSDTDLY